MGENYYATRRRIDKMKKERDYAEHVSNEIKKKGTDRGPENGAYKGAKERAQVLNNLMRHRGE